jgi:hypothetical protein
VMMLSGRFPSEELLARHGLAEAFQPVSAAAARGDVGSLDTALRAGEAFFVARGVLLILERLRSLALRNLVRRVAAITETHLVTLADLGSALTVSGVVVEIDEIECLVANLIVDGFIKGYLSHKKHTLVLSKVKPFPQVQ